MRPQWKVGHFCNIISVKVFKLQSNVSNCLHVAGSHPALPAQPGTHITSLAVMPGITVLNNRGTYLYSAFGQLFLFNLNLYF